MTSTDHRVFVAQLAPLDVWSEDGRRLVGDQWSVWASAPILEPTTRDPVGWLDRVAVTAAGLVAVGVLDQTGAYLADQGHVLEMDLDAAGRMVARDEGIDFDGGTVIGAVLGTSPTWPVWLHLDEQACPSCYAPVDVAHSRGCSVARCWVTGHQRGICEQRHDHGTDQWGGEFPGKVEAREFGWYARLGSSGWTPCTADAPGAQPDLNRLMTEARWDALTRRWVR